MPADSPSATTVTDKQTEDCLVCNTQMALQTPWLFRCPRCHLLKAHLEPGIGAPIHGLESLRRQNFKYILDRISEINPPGHQTLLEIGCAEGWFLDAASQRNYHVVGIEPDSSLATIAQSNGHDVRAGFFPESLKPEERFDVIIFNDVFEHLPNPIETIQTCHDALVSNGLLIINLPDSGGIFYRIARALNWFGMAYPLERLWQKGLSSPHLYYFNTGNLSRLANHHGFSLIRRDHLKSVSLKGLWTRLQSDEALSKILAVPLWIGIALTVPILGLLPKDISVCFLRKEI